MNNLLTTTQSTTQTTQMIELEQQISTNSQEQITLQTELFNARQQVSTIQFKYNQCTTLGKHLQNQLSELKRTNKEQQRQLKQQQSLSQSLTEPKRPVGRPRKDVSQLAPSTRAVMASYERKVAKINANSKYNQYIGLCGENDKRLYSQLDTYIKSHTIPESIEFFINDLRRLHLKQRLNQIEQYLNCIDGPNNPRSNTIYSINPSEIPQWEAYRDSINSVVNYFAAQLNLTPEQFLNCTNTDTNTDTNTTEN